MDSRPSLSKKSATSCLGLCQLTIMNSNENETAVHGWHCRGDMVMRMRKIMTIQRSWQVCLSAENAIGDYLPASRLTCAYSGKFFLPPSRQEMWACTRAIGFSVSSLFVVSILSNRSKANVNIMTGGCTCRCYTQMHRRLLFLSRGAAKSVPAYRLEATGWLFTSVAEDLK